MVLEFPRMRLSGNSLNKLVRPRSYRICIRPAAYGFPRISLLGNRVNRGLPFRTFKRSRSPTREGLREEAREDGFSNLAGVAIHLLIGPVDADHDGRVLLRYVPHLGAESGDGTTVTPNTPARGVSSE